MKFYHQTRFGHSLKEPIGVRGNCLPTCLGCFMHLEPEEMFQIQEHYAESGNDNAHILLDAWLKERGWHYIGIPGHVYNDHYYMMTVRTQKGSIHVVICKNGKVVHDPNPNPSPIVEELSYEALIPAYDMNDKGYYRWGKPQELCNS